MIPLEKKPPFARDQTFKISDERYRRCVESVYNNLMEMWKSTPSDEKEKTLQESELDIPTVYVPMYDLLLANPAMPYIFTCNEISMDISEEAEVAADHIDTSYGKSPNGVMLIDIVEQQLIRTRDDSRLDDYTRKSALHALRNLESIVLLGKYQKQDANEGIILANKAVYFQMMFKEQFLPKEKLTTADEEDKIIFSVARFQAHYKDCVRFVIVSDIPSIRKKAIDNQLNTEPCRYEAVKDPVFVFGPAREIPLDKHLLSDLESQGYVELATACKASGRKVEAFHENEVVRIRVDDTAGEYIILKQGRLCKANGWPLLQKTRTENKNKWPLNPDIRLTQKQQAYMEILLDSSIAVVCAAGKAGSGRLMCAMLAGVTLLERGDHQEIWYTRRKPKDESYSNYKGLALPAKENLKRILIGKNPLPEEREKVLAEIKDMKKKDYFRLTISRFVPEFEVRNVLWIYDGGQYTSRKEMTEIISRVGIGSKLVVIGNPERIGYDLHNPALTLANSGLTHLIDKLKGQKRFAYITFQEEDVARGPGYELARLL